jgi:CheY-like chemotaxis protein
MPKRILVVDDSHYVADASARLIEICGYETRAVYSGKEAIEQTTSFEPDMVLMDIGMPGLDGYQTAAQIRNEPGNADVLLVAVTGWVQDQDKQRAYDHGFDLHVAKPMTLKTLHGLLAMLHKPTRGLPRCEAPRQAECKAA